MKNQIHLIAKKGSAKLLSSINSNLDNVTATGSASINEFLSKSSQNKYYPKRILLFSNSIDLIEKLDELYFYLRENSENTEVVLLCNLNSNNELVHADFVSQYKDTFQESIYQVFYTDSRLNIKKLLVPITESLPELEERARLFEIDNNLHTVFNSVGLESAKTEESFDSWNTENNGGIDGESYSPVWAVEDEEQYVPEAVEEVGNEPKVDDSDVEGYGNFSEKVEENDGNGLGIEPENNDLNIFSLGGIGGQHVETGFLGGGDEEELVEEPTPMTGANEGSEEKPPVGEPTWSGQDMVGMYKEESSWNAEGYVSTGKEWGTGEEIENSGDHQDEWGTPETVEVGESPTEWGTTNQEPTPAEMLHPSTQEKVYKSHGLNFNSSNGVVELVTGTRDIDTSNYVIQEALKLQSQGMKVLIVDFDFKYHNILSNIDINQFTNSQRAGVGVYEEDGLYFLSTGYGSDEKGIEKLLPLVNHLKNRGVYGRILMDAPLDGLGSTLAGLNNISVNLLVRGDYQSFIRAYVAAEEAPYELALNYFYNGRVTIHGGNIDWMDDLEEFRQVVVPGRVDWMNNAYLGQ